MSENARHFKATHDLALAERCVAHDRTAQRELFAAHRGRVHHILFRLLGTNRDIEDLVQEAFLAIFRSLSRYRGEASLATWVDRITTRVAYRHLSERRAPPARIELVVVDDGGVDPEQQAYAREVARRLYAVLDRLDVKYRIAYVLYVIDGRSLEEVADLTASSRVAAKARVWRARVMVEKRASQDPVLASFVVGLKENKT